MKKIMMMMVMMTTMLVSTSGENIQDKRNDSFRLTITCNNEGTRLDVTNGPKRPSGKPKQCKLDRPCKDCKCKCHKDRSPKLCKHCQKRYEKWQKKQQQQIKHHQQVKREGFYTNGQRCPQHNCQSGKH